ncbi:MAG: metallophosphoesterase family protein [Planctomycetota bacterium]
MNPLRLLLFLLLVFPAVSPHAAKGHEPPKRFTEKAQHKPTPLPDRVILTLTESPATSVDVTWRTSTEVEKSVVEVAPADGVAGNLMAGIVPWAEEVAGAHEPFKSDLGTCHMHTARLEGLKPATMYVYRVGDGDKRWSEWHQVVTASDAAEPFTFIYFGDAQNAVRSMWSRVVREANLTAPKAAFMLHAGDLINRANRDAEWGEWFYAGGWLNGRIPSIATPGNHEYDRLPGEDDKSLSLHWRPSFSFPTNGPEGLEETVYWLDYQGVRFVALNSNEQVDRQTEWLRSVLADASRPKWTVVTFHHPIYSAARNRDNPGLRKQWRPLLEEQGVDLVLQGHDHAYARSGLGGPENVTEGVRTKQSNTVYVVSVSGPKMYPVQQTWDMSRAASGVQLFQVIYVSQDDIKYEARLATGELYDAFTLTKNADGVSTLTEQVPETEAIRK